MTNNNNRDFKKVLETLDANEKSTNDKLLSLIDNCITPLAKGTKDTTEAFYKFAEATATSNDSAYKIFGALRDVIGELQLKIDRLEKRVDNLEK